MGTYYPKGVCSRQINVEIKDNKIENLNVIGGCSGNLGGLCSLLKGTDVRDAISKLKGIDCGGRGTSCPDQIAIALEKELEKE